MTASGKKKKLFSNRIFFLWDGKYFILMDELPYSFLHLVYGDGKAMFDTAF